MLERNLLCSTLILFLISILIKTQTLLTEDEDCLADAYYKMNINDVDLFIFTKHMGSANCVKILTRGNENLSLYFHNSTDTDSSFKKTIDFHPYKPLNTISHQIQFFSNVTDTNTAITDPQTKQTVIYFKRELRRTVLIIPYDYDIVTIKRESRKALRMFLDTSSHRLDKYSFNILDTCFLVAEIITTMVVLDAGLIIILIYTKMQWAIKVHRRIMWIVLSLEMVFLLYFLNRYQLFFYTELLFFAYFIVSMVINVFNVLNNGVGVFLDTSIQDKIAYHNTKKIRRLHRYIGFASYILFKIRLILKFVIYLLVANYPFTLEIFAILLVNPVIWLVYLLHYLYVSVVVGKQHMGLAQTLADVPILNKDSRQDLNEIYDKFEKLGYRKKKWFLVENYIIILKDDFLHPGGDFIHSRLYGKHITKYFYGMAALELLPFANLKNNHATIVLDENIAAAKIVLSKTPLFMYQNKNLKKYSDSDWYKNYSWCIEKVQLLSTSHIMFYIKSKRAIIDTGELKKGINNFGKLIVLRFKEGDLFRYSYLQLSQIPHFFNKKRVFYSIILKQIKKDLFQSRKDINEDILISYNRYFAIDFVHSQIQNRFVRKYIEYTVVNEDIEVEDEYVESLPVILKLTERTLFLSYLDNKDVIKLEKRFANKIELPMNIEKKIKMAVGGPFGFENLMKSSGKYMFLFDDSGMFSLQDFSYDFLRRKLRAFTNDDDDEDINDDDLKMSVSFIYKTKIKRFNDYNEFLLGLYFLNKIQKYEFIDLILVFTEDELFPDFVEKNKEQIREFDGYFIMADFKQAFMFNKTLKKAVDRKKIMII